MTKEINKKHWMVILITFLVALFIYANTFVKNPVEVIMDKYGCGGMSLEPEENGSVECQKCSGEVEDKIYYNEYGVPYVRNATPIICKTWLITPTEQELEIIKKEYLQFKREILKEK